MAEVVRAQLPIPGPMSPPPRWRSILRAMRPHQWSKNVLLFVPLVMSHEVRNGPRLIAVTACFVAFSLLASAVYVVNDLVDLEADKAHPKKRTRPFASGALGVRTGLAIVAVSFCWAFALALWALPRAAVLMLAIYALLTTAYSFVVKRKLMLDVLTLAALYTHRILTGGVAAGIVVSEWLLAFSMFLFLSLAFAKRYTELSGLAVGVEGRIQGRGYWARDLDLIRTLGPTSGSIAVLVLVLYVNQSPDVRRLYAESWILYLVCPVVLYWITRIWFLAQRGQLDDDPVVFALKDRVSLLAGGVALGLLYAASWDLPFSLW
jgi:4-hydroxybenzoate polyprenyltransferase